ncbi:conjugal transfer protein TraN [Erwinia typographi]|uniref:conjugal transfer protein TraN n=1 Tax=Erwinia typographi TaxID=371042 RepID=UPI00068EF4D0|nr:conjugal transfer protein TraN [Erwinia typographi]
MKFSLCAALMAALFACAVQASSMDDANKEGVDAAKAASGITSADPNGYFDNYSADAPQKDYYKGGTQTDTSIDVAGQAELSTSDLGKTAQESYVNNPVDSISYDSDMIKHSDDLRGNAEAIAGGTTGQCVEQEVSKTTYTIHSCVMGNTLMQTCSRKATIETTGSRETYDTQLVLNAGSTTGQRTDGYWVQMNLTVPQDGTISSGTWEFLYPKSPSYHGDRTTYTLEVLGQSMTVKLNNSGTFSITPQRVTAGQVITFRIRTNTDGHNDEAADTLRDNLASGTFVARITLPMQAERDTLKAAIVWTSSCPADMGDAVKLSDSCTDPGGNRTVTVSGKTFTLYSDCWEYTQKWMVNEDDTNTCQTYIGDPNCSEGTRTCTQKSGDYCILQSLTYQCAHTVKSTGYVCGSEFYCSDGSCAAMEAGQNQNFEEAVSQLAALAAAGKDFAGMDPDKVTAFTGKAMACRKSAAGFSNCCKSGGWGQDTGLAHCNTEEKEIGTAKEKLLTVKVGSYCAKKVLGVCLEKKEGYCVFDSKLARIVQEQGRRDQLGISFGSGESPDCRGIKIAELQGIRFDAIDFSDFYADLNSQVALPDQDALTKRIQESINSNLSANGGG